MTLHIGIDPGGTGRKIAHLTAALDDDERLFVGHLRAPASFGLPAVQFSSFPYLDAPTRRAIERQLRAALDAPGAWVRTRGRKVGDCLDAFASMMLGPWSRSDSALESMISTSLNHPWRDDDLLIYSARKKGRLLSQPALMDRLS